MTELIQILENLRNEDVDIREKGLKQLRDTSASLTDGDIRILFKAASEEFPQLKRSFNNTNWTIFHILMEYISDEYIPLIIELFPKYNGLSKYDALRLLGLLESREAASTLIRLLKSSASELEFRFGQGILIRGEPRYAEIFFPDLLELEIEPLSNHILELCLKYFEEGLLDSGQLDGYSDTLASLSQSYREQVLPIEVEVGQSWIWEDAYLSIREDFGILIDLLGYFNDTQTRRELVSASELKDPKLRMFAIISRLRRGMKVDSNELLPIAENSETRKWLYKLLLSLNKANLYPQKFFSQRAFAESDMVNWLSFGTELGKVPDEIDTETPTGKVLYYLYRYRTLPPHWAAKDGWMAGISGPFIQSEEPSPDSYGETFSAFRAWDSQTPEEHLGDIQEILDNWREYHNK